MSFAVAEGVAALSGITSSDAFGGITTRETAFDLVPSGFSICTETLPGRTTSVATSGAVHMVAVRQDVVRAEPATNMMELGPGLELANPLPRTSKVKPSAAPAYTLAGYRASMFAPVEMLTFAAPDCDVSSELIATTATESGEGAEPGAV
jgi:hypothetical protein